MRPTIGWVSTDGTEALQRTGLERRDLRPDDVAVRLEFCGVCHSDLHSIHGPLGKRGLVPGHEATGVITATGASVQTLAVGDRVAIGTIVDSCGVCPMCLAGQENFCYEGPTTTYGGKDRVDNSITAGAYSREYVLREKFVFPLPEGLDPAAAAPLLCAGITVWEPMMAAGIGPGSRVAVAGIGGLGHLAVKLAAALGASVVALSRNEDKAEDARRLGASELLLTTDENQVASARGRFDLIIDTVSADHELSPLLRMLDLDGTLCVVGNPRLAGPPLFELIPGRKRITSSGTGGTLRTNELLRFCAEHGITADVEVLPSHQVATALERLGRGDVRYRFVLDLSDLDEA